MTEIQQRITALKNDIAAFAKKYARDVNDINLLAVSKSTSAENIKDAYDCGLRDFGENYLQEALLKINALKNLNIRWHFIGTLQQNKTRKIAEFFDWVHSLSSIEMAQRLNDQRPAHLPPLNVCVQVNVSMELTKGGIAPDKVATLCNQITHLTRLKLRGLMSIIAHQSSFEAQKNQFNVVNEIYLMLQKDGLHLDTLSMGMSQDMEAAIVAGSTLLRIGQRIFGER